MKRYYLKKIIIHLCMHVCALLAVLLVADIVFCSYVSVEFLDGEVRYALDPFPTDSNDIDEAVTDIFAHQASDMMRYVAACKLLGTTKELDVGKIVDISDYYHNRERKVTARFYMSDLINFGRRGITYSERSFNVTEFVYYYGDPLYVDNFALDEYGRLYFKGFESINKSRTYENYSPNGDDLILGEGNDEVRQAMDELMPAELMHLVVDYCVREYPDYVEVMDHAGTILSVSIREPVLGNASVIGYKDLREKAGNWDEYFVTVDEFVEAATLFSSAYDTYREGQRIYDPDNMNLVYLIRTRDDKGLVRTYTNDNGSKYLSDDELTDSYSGHYLYLICYYDQLEYATLSNIPESTLTDIIKLYPDVYPNNTHVWIYLDDTAQRAEDIYYDLNYNYNDVKQVSRFFCMIITLLAFIWLGLFVYIAFVSGVYNADESNEFRIFPQDKIWIEAFFIFGFIVFRVALLHLNFLKELVDENYCRISAENGGPLRNAGISSYLSFAAFGFLCSLSVAFFVFSLVRRLRAGVLYEYSFTKRIKEIFDHFALTLSGGEGAVATVLIPYIFFLVLNLGGMSLAIFMIPKNMAYTTLIFLLMLFMDIIVGINMFLTTAEKKDLLDGVERIRSGEIDYKIDAHNLRAENRNLAISINNIGEGIKSAVNDSIMEETLRTELITNVSHDLKTPITTIINYSDLLRREDLTEKQKDDYLKVIGEKSIRLKKLLEDLLEASKLSSGQFELHKETTDLTELLTQAIGEYSDRFEAKNLEIVTSEFPRVLIYADAGLLWRVFDNLFGNICKYAMKDTKVNVTFDVFGGRVFIKIKNVSAVRPRFQGEALTERFIRGDASRQSEGTGLGLFIAKSLVEAHNGTFEVIVDGDIFTSFIDLPEFSSDKSLY
ncbi:MAG: HAMP domain-containing histidine kinase [Lachnospiraceae bacterium]|nr:HAMP domain-containing histidine kinase [Lachnospiraceae bacterium]